MTYHLCRAEIWCVVKVQAGVVRSDNDTEVSLEVLMQRKY